MELVTGAMGNLLPKLAELLKEEYGLQKGVKNKIQKLSRELEAAHAVLGEISATPQDQLNELVRLWARDVREASYDMEDIIDAFLVHVDVDVDGGGPEPPSTTDAHMLRRVRKKVAKLFKKSKARRDISCQIKEIYDKLEELAARRDRYKTADSVVVTKPAATTIIDPRVLNLYKRATELVGIDGPKDKLIDMLSLVDGIGDDGSDDVAPDTKKMMKVVSVVGFGGLGKTTLAKAVYDQLKPNFRWGAFIPVGQNPDIKKVLRDILIGLDKEKFMNFNNMAMLDERQLMDELKEFVKEKRCFIVIDDIWDEDSWKLIRCAIQESNYASRFIITTRISKVATLADEVYKIQPLSRDNSERLLFARISDGEGKYFDSPSVEACDKILKKCGGVPLAIITIASLLASRPGEDWSEVYNSVGFGHEDNDNVTNTRRILSFSYYDLPSHLKPCLLYLSLFPEDQMIEKNSLIWKWIAEGFITEEQATTARLFELGEKYFNELINRNMIQAQEREYEGYVNACSVHDMVLDLILQLSGEENFVTVLNAGERQTLQGGISRRLALQRVEEHNAGQLANIAVEKVRSIFASDCDFCALRPCLPFLRVVEMSGCSVQEDHEGCTEDMLEYHLGSLLHLRYLRLDSIGELPRKVGYLRFLQTLDLKDSLVQALPEEVGLLTQLVCLRLQTNWPTTVPAGLLGKLTSLQELCNVYCDSKGASTMQFAKELCLLRKLRVLKICYIHVTCESTSNALLESLGHLHNIQELEIFGISQKFVCSVSDAGSVSCRHLRFLHLDDMVFSVLPAWIKSSLAPNLSYLNVEVVAVREQDMETLAKLPELSCLILHSKKSDTKSTVSIKIPTEGVGYFRKLRFLKIFGSFIRFDLHSSECKVASSNTIMPSLESLEFGVHVRSLKDENLHLGLDKLLGFQNLGTSSLQKVSVGVNCEDACFGEVGEVEAALKHAAAVHPKHPTLRTNRVQSQMMISRYQEACMEMSRAPELVVKAWKLADIVGSEDLQILRLPDPEASSSKVMRLLYTDNGMELLALTSKAVHKLWKWDHSDKNPCGKVMTTFMAPPPAATFLAFYPMENINTIAIGRDDSSIQFYNVRTKEEEIVFVGHQKKITGLAFSKSKHVLVSSGADAQLCVWSYVDGEKKKSTYIQPPSDVSGPLVGDTMVQFHHDEMHLLVVHESQLAIYDWQLECLCSWFPRDALPAPISSAVYSLGCLLVYAGFRDGAIGIFEAESLTLQCRIAPSAYIPSLISSNGETIYPTAITTHPWKPNQIAVGMSDGAVLVLEPLDTDDRQVESNASSE